MIQSASILAICNINNLDNNHDDDEKDVDDNDEVDGDDEDDECDDTEVNQTSVKWLIITYARLVSHTGVSEGGDSVVNTVTECLSSRQSRLTVKTHLYVVVVVLCL